MDPIEREGAMNALQYLCETAIYHLPLGEHDTCKGHVEVLKNVMLKTTGMLDHLMKRTLNAEARELVERSANTQLLESRRALAS